MKEDQEIYKKIGETLWSIMPESASTIYCVGMVYPDTYQIGPEWVNNDGTIGSFGFDNYPHDVTEQIYKLVFKLQTSPFFAKEPWTHFKASLTEAGKFKIDFAYIPQEDSWPGLFMKGVSELTKEEAKKNFISETDWGDCVKKFGWQK